MNTDIFIDKRSLEEIIEGTAIDEHCNFVVKDILRDMNNDWKLEYFKDDGKNSHDVIITKMKNECNRLEAEIKINEQLIKKLDIDIIQARLPKNDRNHKITKKGDTVLWDKKYVQAQEDIYNNTKLITEIKELLETYVWNRYLEERMRQTLRWLRGRFMKDRDEIFLAKGVSWALNYNKKLRINIHNYEYEKTHVNETTSVW